jgi:diguanylate cyclase (GGDEF)-like protein
MAATPHHPRADPLPAGEPACLSEPALRRRLEEEIDRARRYDAPLSCLLVRLEDLLEMPSAYGDELPVQTLAYVAEALRRELRSFDRIGRLSEDELLITLPGADGARAEIVGRRVLDRLRMIKVEADGARRPLSVSVGLAAWHGRLSGEELLMRIRAAVRLGRGDRLSSPPADDSSGPIGSPPALRRP